MAMTQNSKKYSNMKTLHGCKRRKHDCHFDPQCWSAILCSRSHTLKALLKAEFCRIESPKSIMTSPRTLSTAPLFLFLTMWTGSVESFLLHGALSSAARASSTAMSMNALPASINHLGSTEIVAVLDGLKGPIQSYVNIW
jgi:hypothetical protein